MNSVLELFGISAEDVLAQVVVGIERAHAVVLRHHLDTLPTLDYQLTMPQVAAVLAVDVSTVRDYTGLADGHPRKLHMVATSDTARSHRVALSQLTDWQRRNRTDPDDPETLRRKAAAARQTRPKNAA